MRGKSFRRYSRAMNVLVLIAFALPSLISSAVEQSCYGEFTAELRERELWLGLTCRSSCSGSADTRNVPCEPTSETVSPFVQLRSCSPSAANGTTTVFSASHTLVTHLTHQANCTSGECFWKLELAEQYLASPCIDVHVADFTTVFPPLRGIRKRIWVPSYYEHSEEIQVTCEGECRILDNSTYEDTVTVALLQQENSYYFHHSSEEANITSELPQCLQDTALLQWTNTQAAAVCSNDHHTFTPSRVYAVSSTEVFITGNNSILYSPCRNCVWYQLLLPSSHTVTSFTYFSNIFYALLTTSSESSAGVWMGINGLSPVLPVYPSPGLTWLWSNSTSESTPSDPNSFLASASLTIDTQGNLMAVSGSDEMQLPVPILLSHALYDYHLNLAELSNSTPPILSSLHLLSEADGTTLKDKPHQLLSQSPLICLLRDVLVAAPVCDRVTRSVVEIVRTGFLQFVNRSTLSLVNCSLMDDVLPTDIFLGLGERYVFSVQLIVNPVIAAEIEMDQLGIVSTVSTPDVVQVVTEGTFHTINNTMTYEVIFVEMNASNAQKQVPPSTVLKSVDIALMAGSVGMECVHPLSHRPKLLGRLQTSVHVGCPPGVSLVFDDVTTQSHDNQFCSPTANISCYYFGNEFRPVLQLVDSVTGARSTYTGPYTLRVLAGGTSVSHMETFDSGQNIESQVWTASGDDILNHSNNKIEWVCGLGSPCGEIIPGRGRSPEYYLYLQASNRLVGRHETYCDLTVEFTIQVHGMSMGPITTLVTLFLLLVLLAIPLLSLFPVWVWRERRGGGKGRVGGWKRGIHWGREMAGHLHHWLEELAKKYRQRRPLEPHLHED